VKSDGHLPASNAKRLATHLHREAARR